MREQRHPSPRCRVAGIAAATAAALSLVSSCALHDRHPPGKAATLPTGSATTLPSTHTDSNLVQPTVWMQQSAEYRTIRRQNFLWAGSRIATLDSATANNRPAAVLMEVESVALDLTPYNAQRTRDDEGFPKSLPDWLASHSPNPHDDALEFARQCEKQGVALFYAADWPDVPPASLATLLDNSGFPDADPTHVRTDADAQGRDQLRKRIAESHDLILQIADGLEDVSIAYHNAPPQQRMRQARWMKNLAGSDFILFPNPAAGGWLDAVYSYDPQLNDEQRHSILRGTLDFNP